MLFLRSRIPLLCLLIASIYLSGCATVTKTSPPSTANNISPAVLHKQHMTQIASIEHFAMKGRFAIITKPKNHSARMHWQHSTEEDKINIYSPIGGKVANIIKTPTSVKLTDNSKKTLEAQDAESLTEQTLGFRLPLSGLSYWILGKPSDDSLVNMMQWDQNGRISALQQDGWDIQYKDYAEHSGYFLPRKVTLKNERLTIKLVTDKWSDLLAASQ